MPRVNFAGDWNLFIIRRALPFEVIEAGSFLIHPTNPNLDFHKNSPQGDHSLEVDFPGSQIKFKRKVNPDPQRYRYEKGQKLILPLPIPGVGIPDFAGEVKIPKGKKKLDDPDDDATWVATSKPPVDITKGSRKAKRPAKAKAKAARKKSGVKK